MEAPGGDFRLTGNGILPSALIVPGIVGAGTCADQQTHDQPRMQAGAGRAIRLCAKWDLEEVSRGERSRGQPVAICAQRAAQSHRLGQHKARAEP